MFTNVSQVIALVTPLENAITKMREVLDDVGPTLGTAQAQARAECRRIVEAVEVRCFHCDPPARGVSIVALVCASVTASSALET